MLNSAEQKQLARFEERIRKNRKLAAPAALGENPVQKQKRIDGLLGNFEKFCEYYFPQYMRGKFGWFHKRAAKLIIADPDIFAALEWPRGHAKSVFAGIMMPLYLKAKGDLLGMVLVSATQDKAEGLLCDLQAELESNARYIADFGPQCNYGRWAGGEFVTNDGTAFYAFGRGQSPRGVREGAQRPNYIFIDDIDDDKRVKNEALVDEDVEWVEGALFPCLPAEGGRVVLAGNRIHRKSILAKLIGDVENGQAVKPGVTHIKVFATENPRTHEEDQNPETGVPAWKEYWTWERLRKVWAKMRPHMVQREFYHKHYVLGKVFKREWIKFVPVNAATRRECRYVTSYNDPSWKNTGDYKAIVTVALHKGRYLVLEIFCRQVTRTAMVAAHYDQHDRLRDRGFDAVSCYYEANAIQGLHGEVYLAEGEKRGYQLPIRKDEARKANKEDRIERLAGFFQRDILEFDEALRNTPDFQVFLDQLLGFPDAANDDGPDAAEGAISQIETKIRLFTPEGHSTGGQRRSNRW